MTMNKTPHFINNNSLKEIRQNTDWKTLFNALHLEKDEHKSKSDDWWAKSPLTEEKTASFHLNENGFYCFSTSKGGGVIELVQAVIKQRTGKTINCYEAGKWLLENGASSLSLPSKNKQQPAKDPLQAKPNKNNEGKKELPENRPIRQNLIPCLSQQGEHPEFKRRNISKATCEYLGCGYLEKSRGEMQGRIIFQVRGVQKEQDSFKTVILSHIGRATTHEQEEQAGKWNLYSGFRKTLELYNIDKVLLDPPAIEQAKKTKRVLIVEGCFDVAKLVEAHIYNMVASFGAHLDENQIPKIKLIADTLKIAEFLIWYDRDQAGKEGQEKAITLLQEAGYQATGFDWDKEFADQKRGPIKIPDPIKDVGDFSVKQLRWLRERGVI
jgi:5S rRNA maturation endonuclease (ribonuclease M5)